MIITKLFYRAFLQERPSLSLGLFRIAVAWTVGAHVIPSFFHMQDNYLSTAFKTYNTTFFPISILEWIAASPDWLVWAMALYFCVALFTFAIGLFSQISCIFMTLGCYYFYALNDFHIGTLSWDILLVTLFLMCITNYHGDFFSIDSLRRADAYSYKRRRPYFLQRLLQLQIFWTFLYTAISKATLKGNWLTGNPYYYLMHNPPTGVVRDFPFRSYLASHQDLCYSLGIALIIFECVLPFLWLIPRTRFFSIPLGIAFQFMLWTTLHVPTIFLFLFPPMMLLFIRPERFVAWIWKRHAYNVKHRRATLLFDGNCGFCRASVKRLRVLDIFHWMKLFDFHTFDDLKRLHPQLTKDRCESEMVLLEPGKVSGGFYAFRRISLHAPMLMPLAPFLYLPGIGWIGDKIYKWVAKNRLLLHRNPACTDNSCYIQKGV